MELVKPQHFLPVHGEYAFLCAHAQLALNIGNTNTGLIVSNHACREELEEVMKLVKPQHFLPVHGEYAFLCAHAQLARDIGITNTSVIRNGAFLGVSPKRNGRTVSSGSMQVLGDAKLQLFYNDGNKASAPLCLATSCQAFAHMPLIALPLRCGGGCKVVQQHQFCWFTLRLCAWCCLGIRRGKHKVQDYVHADSAAVVQGTGTADEMALEERTTISTEGCVIADVAVVRPPLQGAIAQQEQQAPMSEQDASAAKEQSDQEQQDMVCLTALLSTPGAIAVNA